MRALHALDFDDLLVETLRLLSEDERVQKRWQSRFRYPMIDEYQDTNHCQLSLCGYSVSSTGTWRSSAMMISRSMRGAARTVATSSSLKNSFLVRRSSSWKKTIARREESSKRRTR